MSSLFERLKQRKMAQWALAYLAGAWLLLEVSDVVGGRFGLPDALYRGLVVVLGAGLLVTLVLAWYHGERGRQRVSGPELLLIAGLTVIAGALVRFVVSAGLDSAVSTSDGSLRTDADAITRIAVLPFENQTADPEQEYFAVGMTEAVISDLSQVGLNVLTRQSVLPLAGLPPPEIAQALNVDAVLMGSVFRSAERMRLDMRFMNAMDQRMIWQRSFDTTMTAENVFDVQSSIASDIATALEHELTPLAAERLAARPTTDDVALNSVQLGRFKWLTAARTADYHEAIDHFSDAIARDSLYANAWDMRGTVRSFLVSVELSENPSQDLRNAKNDALRALALDSLNIVPNGGSARAHLAFILMYEWDFDGAEREFRRAVNEMGQRAGGPYPLFMSMTGRHDEAIATWKSYETTFDNSTFMRINQGSAFWWASRYDEGLELVQRLPPPARVILATPFLFRAGLVEQGQALLDSLYGAPIALNEGLRRMGVASGILMAMEASAAQGRMDEARRHFEHFRLQYEHEAQAPFKWAAAYAILGDEERALETLRSALERRDPTLAWIGQTPEIDILRGHPEFQEIARAVGVPNPRLGKTGTGSTPQ